jgi:serine/threonine protein kinase
MANHSADDSSSPPPTPAADADADDGATVFTTVPKWVDISIDQAADSILRAGILDDTSLSAARHELEDAGTPPDGGQLLDYLTKSGRLTSFQARRVAQGRSGELLLGNYILLSRIGRGGMGAVYKALHRRMKRIVAVKTIRKGLATAEFITRFRREIEAAARLTHPHIISAYDADECELGDFLVMEYVEGSNLRQIVEKTGPLSLRDAVTVLRQTAQALSFAHLQGVVHRDIKPANLMRDVNGVTKVADLGLARLIEPGGAKDTGSGLTQAGVVAGTVDYLPPEQANDSSTVDHRADIYSLGCTFFHILTGERPFGGGTVLERILAHRDVKPPSLAEHVGDATPELDAIFQKMLAKSREDRFQSMDEVLAALDEALPEDGSSVSNIAIRTAQETTVLIVEESRLQAGMITKLLRSLDIDDVHVASNAAEAIDKLAALPAHVVLVSSELADMSGLQFVERMRDEIRWARTPALVMASSPLPEPVKGAIRRKGSTGLIQKPFDAPQLKKAIDKLLTSDSGESGVLSALAVKRVLIVDDSSVARRKIQQTLTELGFVDFTMAEDGLDGADRLKQEPFDLVITDYNMPRMDGEQFVSWIRTESSQREIPVVMVTTEFDPTKLAQVYQLGVSAICGKSFEADQVRNIVVRLFL